MAKYRRTFCLEVLTPDGPVCTADAVQVSLPAADGYIGILGGHAPLVAMLGAGTLTVDDESDQRRHYFVAGGFVHVRDNAMSILAEECVLADNLDLTAAASQLQRAEEMSTESDEAASRRKDAISVAKAKMKMAQNFKAEANR